MWIIPIQPYPEFPRDKLLSFSIFNKGGTVTIKNKSLSAIPSEDLMAIKAITKATSMFP